MRYKVSQRIQELGLPKQARNPNLFLHKDFRGLLHADYQGALAKVFSKNSTLPVHAFDTTSGGSDYEMYSQQTRAAIKVNQSLQIANEPQGRLHSIEASPRKKPSTADHTSRRANLQTIGVDRENNFASHNCIVKRPMTAYMQERNT